jgi:GT2 family glycosyltransferase
MKKPLVSIIISNYNGKELLKECLSNLLQLKYNNFEVIIIDAGSSDGSPDMIRKEFPSFKLIDLKKTVGIGEALNIGIAVAKGEYIILDLNNDDIVSPEWLDELIKVVSIKNDIGVVGGKRLLSDTGKIDSAGGKYVLGLTFAIGHGRNESDERYNHFYEVDYVPVLLVKKEVIEKIGLLDINYFIYGEDVDFCLRAKLAKYKVVYSPRAVFKHKRSSTIGEFSPKKLYYLFKSRFRIMFKILPYYKIILFVIIHTFLIPFLYLVYYTYHWSKEMKFNVKNFSLIEFPRSIISAIIESYLDLKSHIRARYETLFRTKIFGIHKVSLK